MIRWITDKLGTASYYDYESLQDSIDVVLIDVRELTDKEGNKANFIMDKIQAVLKNLQDGRKVVICCDKGISRSNAIALGVLMASGISYEESLQILNKNIGARDINLGLLYDIRSLYEEPKIKQKVPTNILITGSTGFIGRFLVNVLKSDYELFCPSHKELDLTSDLTLLDLYINKNKIGFIVHLAHPKSRNNITSIGESIIMIKNILEICRLNGLGLLYISGLVVFSGHTTGSIMKANSSLKLNPKGVYAESKYFCEEMIRLYQETWGINAVILRPAALYGKEMDRSTFVSKFFELAIKGETIYTHEYNNGLPVFDFLYLDDLVDAIRLAIQVKPKIPVNIGTGKGTSTYELAQAIVKAVDSNSSVKTIQIQDETYKVIVDPSESETYLGWKAKIDLNSGIKELWDYYRNQNIFSLMQRKDSS
jgi:UDP-glucuronate decarboxylase